MADTILNHPNWLFISFEQAARGHRLARVLAALPEVYWYSHPDNGIKSYQILGPTNIQQRLISKYHYNRYTPSGNLPPPHDFVKAYLPDEQDYYENVFVPRFLEAQGDRLLDKYLLPYCTHALPRDIYRYFPNAKIINIIHDVDTAVNRYKRVGLEFPGFVKHYGIVPEDNHHILYLDRLQQRKGDKLKVKDVWADQKYGTEWNDSMFDACMFDKRWFFEIQHNARVTTEHPNVLNITNLRDYKKMKEFIRG